MNRFLCTLLLAATPAFAWQPVAGTMLTSWGEKLTPDTAWREYPRPDLARTNWTNLNGLWQYAVTPQDPATAPTAWQGEILVPFAIEAPLSGVGKRITAQDALWYRRTFDAPKARTGDRTLLNFEAVDYSATVWVNDTQVGTHTGGNLPFSLDVTAALREGSNTLTLRVTDATDALGAYQLHGKQTENPRGIWYTPVSGIWQTVWLETVPATHVAALKITPHIDGHVSIEINPGASPAPTAAAKVTASLGGRAVATAESKNGRLELRIPNPQLWSPASPTLYDLSISYGNDTVTSYVGLRETSIIKDAAGSLRLGLNGQVLFHFGPLDQGWWPDGLLTPPSDEGMRSDLEFLKAAGFNGLRKHIKVEPRRYYYHCDKLGLIVWQDQVSNGHGHPKDAPADNPSPAWTRLAPNPVDAPWPDAAHTQFMTELKGMMDSLYNHPCIVVWVTFNEAWGQHRTVEVGQWATAYDPTRQINVASGGNFWPAGHIVDAHNYPHPAFPFNQDINGRFNGYVKVMGEFGGHGYPVEGHQWNVNVRNWGYGGLPKDKDEWLERYKTSIAKLAELKQQGIAAGIYTQTTDVEGEINGLLTYDRKVQKLAPAVLAEIHRAAGISGK
jgi:beta-galactosidase